MDLEKERKVIMAARIKACMGKCAQGISDEEFLKETEWCNADMAHLVWYVHNLGAYYSDTHRHN